MTEWLLNRLAATGDVSDPARRGRLGRLAGILGITGNLLLSALKFLAAALSGSVSILADAVNNLSDASSSLISLLGFRMAMKPADHEHPYGHARYEYLAGLAVAVLILVIGVEIGKSGLEKVLRPQAPEHGWLSIGVLAVSILVKLFMRSFNAELGRRIRSQTLTATAADSRNDVLATGAVLLAALIHRFTGLNLDGWMALAVAVFILWSGAALVRDTLDPLLGRAPDPELVEDIRRTIMSYPGVLGTHDLLVHDYGPGRRFASVHVEMAAETDVLQSHDVIDDIERDFLQKHNLHMIVHLDPIVTKDEELQDLRGWLSEKVKELHPELSIHDLRLVKGKTKSNLIFDCVKPRGMAMSDQALKRALSMLVQRRHPGYRCVITIDESFAALPGQSG